MSARLGRVVIATVGGSVLAFLVVWLAIILEASFAK